MHAVNLYIGESQSENSFQSLKNELMTDSHVVNVAFNSKMPHDMLVEYDEAYVSPSSILSHLEAHGLHVDVTGG
ncbi:MAG: hypothetical protein OEY29_04515 [Gammaproteobacteria bacterium]|nr:hypothetical protein [Gammaproteobacteria bacterium]